MLMLQHWTTTMKFMEINGNRKPLISKRNSFRITVYSLLKPKDYLRNCVDGWDQNIAFFIKQISVVWKKEKKNSVFQHKNLIAFLKHRDGIIRVDQTVNWNVQQDKTGSGSWTCGPAGLKAKVHIQYCTFFHLQKCNIGSFPSNWSLPPINK